MDISSWFEFTTFDAIFLVIVLGLFFYWLTRKEESIPSPPPEVSPLPMTDMTLQELRKYDGINDDHILFALNGTIYDVTRGKNFYGPGKAYGTLAGYDATRALGKINEKLVSTEWDDHDGMSPEEIETANEWESRFQYKYLTVGRLVKKDADKRDYGGKLSFIRGNQSLESIYTDKKND